VHYSRPSAGSERFLERGIMGWQVVAGMADAKLLAERGNARPHPAVAKLVTVYLLNVDDPSVEG